MTEIRTGHFDGAIPGSGERFQEVARIGDVRIEHIVSSAHPDPGEQVQDWDEWVVVAAGSAVLEVAGTPRRLTGGDWLLIPAGTRHRVLGTKAGTQWIAVHGPARPAS